MPRLSRKVSRSGLVAFGLAGFGLAALLVFAPSGNAAADPVVPEEQILPPEYAPPTEASESDEESEGDRDSEIPIPDYTEGEAVRAPGGGYCYVGSHPVNQEVAAGGPWHEDSGQHIEFYKPIDLRLFALHDGCYYFIGNPADFGYQGTTYGYYGAHPVAPSYGNGWCFMIGGHQHLWAPFSSHFGIVGSWYSWQGQYDPVFWSYWRYYSYYYRTFYPRYYGGGRFAMRRGAPIAPRIHRVPVQPHGGSMYGGSPRGGGSMRGGSTGTGVQHRMPPTGPRVTNIYPRVTNISAPPRGTSPSGGLRSRSIGSVVGPRSVTLPAGGPFRPSYGGGGAIHGGASYGGGATLHRGEGTYGGGGAIRGGAPNYGGGAAIRGAGAIRSGGGASYGAGAIRSGGAPSGGGVIRGGGGFQAPSGGYGAQRSIMAPAAAGRPTGATTGGGAAMFRRR